MFVHGVLLSQVLTFDIFDIKDYYNIFNITRELMNLFV